MNKNKKISGRGTLNLQLRRYFGLGLAVTSFLALAGIIVLNLWVSEITEPTALREFLGDDCREFLHAMLFMPILIHTLISISGIYFFIKPAPVCLIIVIPMASLLLMLVYLYIHTAVYYIDCIARLL